jgi:rhodanese-related sulfurtransferase
MDHLRENGFEHTAVIDEGVRHWHDEGYPVVEGPNPGTLADAE